MATKIMFADPTPINYQKVSMPVSFVFAYVHPITQHYRQKKYEEYEK